MTGPGPAQKNLQNSDHRKRNDELGFEIGQTLSGQFAVFPT